MAIDTVLNYLRDYSIFLLAIYPFLEGKRDALVWPVRQEVNKKWHRFGWAIRFICVGVAFSMSPYILFAIPYAFYFPIVFDITYNKGIGEDTFFVGNTADWDKFFGKRKFLILFILFFISLTILIISKL